MQIRSQDGGMLELSSSSVELPDGVRYATNVSLRYEGATWYLLDDDTGDSFVLPAGSLRAIMSAIGAGKL